MLFAKSYCCLSRLTHSSQYIDAYHYILKITRFVKELFCLPYLNFNLFVSAPELTTKMHYCDHALSVVRPLSICCNFFTFSTFLWKRSMVFNDTWQDARSENNQPVLCFGAIGKQRWRFWRLIGLGKVWLPYRSDFPPISWPLYRAWPSPNYEWFSWSICNGCG